MSHISSFGMIPKSLPSDVIRGWKPIFGQDDAALNVAPDIRVQAAKIKH
jgi:hypothetical protein